MQWQFWQKFQSKLIVLLTFSTITPVLVVGGYNVIISTQSLTNLVTEQMSDQVANNAEKVSIFLNTGKEDILYLSEVQPVAGIIRARDNKGIDKQDNSTTESWQKKLEITFNGIMQYRNYYYQLRYIDENGDEIVKVIGEKGNIKFVPSSKLQNKAQTDYFKKTIKLKKGEVYISPINLNRENNKIELPYKPVIRYSTPIYNEEGKIRGMLVANVLADAFLNINQGRNTNMRVLIVNEQGYYLQHPDAKKRWGFEFGNNSTINKDYSDQIVKKILTESKGFIQEDQSNLLSFAQIYPNSKTKENPIFIIYEAPKKLIFASLNNFTIVAIIITIVSLGVILIIGIWNIRKIIASISKLTDTVSGFSVQILTTVAQQERLLNTQAASVQETTVTIDELTASSQQSAQQAESALTGARLALEQVETGNFAVEKTVNEMENLKQKVELIGQEIINLTEQINQINNISQLVRDLANQTNMLALNAAVEAVRAGEQGKGFSVVASEIRRLADGSKKSSQNISNIVNKIQNAINSTVIVTEEGAKNLEKTVKIAEQTAGNFSNLSGAIEQIVSNSQQIALNAKQQAMATEQVLRAMSDISQGSMEAAAGISQTKEGTKQLNETVVNLKSIL